MNDELMRSVHDADGCFNVCHCQLAGRKQNGIRLVHTISATFTKVVTYAGVAAGVGRAFSRVYLCLCVCPRSKRKTALAITTKLGIRVLYSRRSACMTQRSKIKVTRLRKSSRSHGF